MLYPNSTDAIESHRYPIPMETMGERIRMLRQARGLSQSQLADRVGVTPGAVSHWELGQTKNMQLETFLKLCAELGTNPHYLALGAAQLPGPRPPTSGRRQA